MRGWIDATAVRKDIVGAVFGQADLRGGCTVSVIV